MKTCLIAVALFVLGSTAYCQSGGTQENQSIPTIVVPEVVTTKSVGATLSSDSSDYTVGSPVHLTFTITNHAKGTANYEFSSGQLYDFVISDSTGKAIWHWSNNRVFNQLITHLNVASNASVVYNVLWSQRDDEDHPVPAGSYSAMAQLVPMARPEITGNLLSNPDNDPVNTGVPMIGPVESGAVNVKNTTPVVYAKTTFKIDASVS